MTPNSTVCGVAVEPVERHPRCTGRSSDVEKYAEGYAITLESGVMPALQVAGRYGTTMERYYVGSTGAVILRG
jgi:hypothetical protein